MDCSYPNWDRVSITLKARKAADKSAAFLAFSVIELSQIPRVVAVNPQIVQVGRRLVPSTGVHLATGVGGNGRCPGRQRD